MHEPVKEEIEGKNGKKKRQWQRKWGKKIEREKMKRHHEGNEKKWSENRYSMELEKEK